MPTDSTPSRMTDEQRHNLEYHYDTLNSALYRLRRCEGLNWDHNAEWRKELVVTIEHAEQTKALLKATLEADRKLLRQERGWQ